MDEYQIGEIADGADGRPYRFKGGDPNDKANWELAEDEGPGLIEGSLRAAGQGATFGFSDEAYAGLRGLAAMVPGGERPADVVERVLASEREQAKQFRKAHPVVSFGAELGGGVLTGGAAGSLLKKTGVGATRIAANTAARLAAEGAVGGAAAGAGGAEGGWKERLRGAVVGGAAGAAFGRALHGFDVPYLGPATGAGNAANKIIAQRGSQAVAKQAGTQAAAAAEALGLPEVSTRTPISTIKPKMVNDFEGLVETMGDTPATRKAARADIEQMKLHDPEFVGRPTTEEAVLEASKDVDVGELLQREQFTPLSGPEHQALRSAYAQHVEQQAALEAQLGAAGAPDSPHAQAIKAKLEEVAARGREILKQDVTGGSQQGLDFRMRRIENEYLATRNLDPLTWHGRAQRALGDRDVPPGVLKKIDELIAAKDRKGLADLISGLGDPLKLFSKDWSTYIAEVVKPALLTGMTSITKPLAGNPINAAFRVLNAPTTTGWGNFVAWAAKKGSGSLQRLERLGAREAFALGKQGAIKETKGTIERGLSPAARSAYELTGSRDLAPVIGFRRTAKRVANLVRRGAYTPEQIAATPVTPLANMFKDVTYGIQGGLDAPFRGAATAIATREISRDWSRVAGPKLAEALRLDGMPPSEIKQILAMTPELRAAHFEANPTPSMELAIQDIAGEATFQNENVFHDLAKGLKRGTRKILGKQAGDVAEALMPLTKTGGGIAQAAVETTPLGFGAGLWNTVKLRSLVNEVDPDVAKIFKTQHRAVRQFGRSAGSTTALGMYLGYKWMSEGRMAGDVPDDATERAQYFNENKSPYAMRGMKRWIPPTLLQPFASSVVVGAKIAEAVMSGGSVAKAAATAPVETARTLITEQPFYRGLAAGAATLAKKGQAQGQTIPEALGATLVPAGVNQLRKFVDPVPRRREGALEEIQNRVPWWSKGLEPQVKPTTGEPKQIERSLGGRLGEFVDPTGSAPLETEYDPVLKELARVGAAVGNPAQQKRAGETAKDYTARLQEGGKLVQQVMTAFINGDNPEILDEHGIYEWGQGDDVTGFERYQALRAGEQTPAALAEQAEILEDAVSRVRSRATRLKRAAAREAAGG